MSEQERKGVLVLGAGIAGMEASLLLSRAGRKVHLVERRSYTGGDTVRFEEVYPTLECASCMLSPRQQDLLQDANIRLLVNSELEEARPLEKGFRVRIRKRASCIDPIACIGCGACYEPCPVSVPNQAEMGLSQRKAVFVPFPGALPNLPVIDRERCLHLNGQDCHACQDACVFAAIDFEQKDELIELEVDAIVVATGAKNQDLSKLPAYGYQRYPEVYTALELERLYSSNGPTGGKIVSKQGKVPGEVALVHCAGRESKGYCSAVCCMYLLKFNHYLRNRIPDVKIHEFYTDLCIPGQDQQRFFTRMMEGGTDLVRASRLHVEESEGRPLIVFESGNGVHRRQAVDMVILAPSLEPREDAGRLAEMLGLKLDEKGFFSDIPVPSLEPPNGIYVVGSARGPMGADGAVAEARAAVSKILSSSQEVD